MALQVGEEGNKGAAKAALVPVGHRPPKTDAVAHDFLDAAPPQ
jgi:hypothetical protein